MDDKQVEQAQADSTIPRVKKEHIEQLFSRVEYVLVQPEGTTTTLCLAYLPGKDGMKFLLAQGTSACVSPALFNAEIGNGIARRNAEAQAMQELWKLEGYTLFQLLNVPVGTFYTRLVTEQAELADRAGKLSEFFSKDAYRILPEEDRLLLQEQFGHMTRYLAVLNQRVARLPKEA